MFCHVIFYYESKSHSKNVFITFETIKANKIIINPAFISGLLNNLLAITIILLTMVSILSSLFILSISVGYYSL